MEGGQDVVSQMVAVVQDMIDAPLPILAKIHQILEECLKNGLAYRTILSAVDVLVHPSNRGKLGPKRV